MTRLTDSTSFLLLVLIFHQSLAAPVQFQRWESAGSSTTIRDESSSTTMSDESSSATVSDESTLKVTTTPSGNTFITSYSSRIIEKAFWGSSTPNNFVTNDIPHSEGMDWVPSPAPDSAPWPILPADVPYPIPQTNAYPLPPSFPNSFSDTSNAGVGPFSEIGSDSVSGLTTGSGSTEVDDETQETLSVIKARSPQCEGSTGCLSPRSAQQETQTEEDEAASQDIQSKEYEEELEELLQLRSDQDEVNSNGGHRYLRRASSPVDAHSDAFLGLAGVTAPSVDHSSPSKSPAGDQVQGNVANIGELHNGLHTPSQGETGGMKARS